MIKIDYFTDLWDEEGHDVADLKPVNLDELHSCREIGRVIGVSTSTKVVQVEVCTQNNTQILQYDLVKLPLDFMPWPGTNQIIYCSENPNIGLVQKLNGKSVSGHQMFNIQYSVVSEL